MSENITVRRIVDRYLEHGRIFIFHNRGDQHIFLGSADWMNRNIYKRIEVCFPLYNPTLKKQILDIIDLQFRDNMQAVQLDSSLRNIAIIREEEDSFQSQKAIYEFLSREVGLQKESTLPQDEKPEELVQENEPQSSPAVQQ